MAFDPKEHVIDPATGLLVHKDGTHIVGLTSPVAPPAEFSEFPKWVVPHVSHIHLDQYNRAHTPGWSQYHMDRDNVLTVLVHDADEEHRAISPEFE